MSRHRILGSGVAREGNRLRNLPAEIFSGLLHLQYLDLSGNQIPHVEAREWKFHESIANKIAELPGNIFAANCDLRYLNLSNNRLGTLDADTFAANTELRLLALWGNPLDGKLRFREARLYQNLQSLQSFSAGQLEEDMTLRAGWFVKSGSVCPGHSRKSSPEDL
eukprot:gnl/TRDRNA2_/TRDRNA2_94158_c0_seq1.p1 gnl/TRDRNA2_/TRDRNA2_94158_c0~~gnl/TRDRNA2_/TRDRNA2_94158_c0_seq1.p1  ORF type:complete len:165 (+),score=30.37 gnl/TRDRNA2_/TRDRNA2_94158_c0_seq1:88-582(+)